MRVLDLQLGSARTMIRADEWTVLGLQLGRPSAW